MRVLALDAALGPCSAAMVANGVTLAERSAADPRGASSALPSLVQAVLAGHSGFDCVAVTVGPGSFTGIRAALALAHGLGIGAGVPVIGVTSVAALAAACAVPRGGCLWVAVDTRRGGVFLWRGGEIVAVPLDGLPAAPPGTLVAGDAAEAVALRTGAGLAGVMHIEARHVAGAAASEAAQLPPQPLYIALPEARTSALRPAPA